MYIALNENVVQECIPDILPDFPDFPIESRYSAEFLATCVHVDDETEVYPNWIYNPETGTFAAPPTPEPEPEPEPEGYTITEEEVSAAYEEGVNNVE